MLQTIRGRLVIAYFFLILLALAGAGATFFYISARSVYIQAQQTLRVKALDVQMFVNHFGTHGDLVKTLNLYMSCTSRSDGIGLQVVDSHGRLLLYSGPDSSPDADSIRRITAITDGTYWNSRRQDYDVLHLSTAIKKGDRVLAYADYSRSLEELGDVNHRLLLAFAQLGALLTVVAMLLSFVLTRRILQPVADVRQVAARMAGGNLGVRVPLGGSDELGELGKTINTLADEIQRNIDSVTEEKNKLDAILSSMVDGVITIRHDGTVTFSNSVAGRAMADYAQWRRSQGEADTTAPDDPDGPPTSRPSRLVGSHLFSLVPPTSVQELVTSCIASGEAVSREIKLGEKEFNVFAIPLKARPGGRQSAQGGTVDAEGELADVEVMLLLRDVTSLRQVEIARSQFLGNVSHELKTPLTIIKGFVVTLQKSPGITDEWQRYLDFIDRETDRLARLVDDLLNLARLRSKRTQMSFTFCEPTELLKETYRQLLPQAAKYDVTLNFDCQEDLPVLLADSDRFKEVIINLVDNAFKYSPTKTRVDLKADATPELLVVTVRDSGPGIPAEEVPYLFERFFRGTDKGGRKAGGSGIGLAIVKEIVDAHRGNIRVESKIGEGTKFIIELPLRQAGRRRSDKGSETSI